MMTYQELNQIFQQYDNAASVFEAHGIATAMLCVDANVSINQWLNDIFVDEIDLSTEEKTA